MASFFSFFFFLQLPLSLSRVTCSPKILKSEIYIYIFQFLSRRKSDEALPYSFLFSHFIVYFNFCLEENLTKRYHILSFFLVLSHIIYTYFNFCLEEIWRNVGNSRKWKLRYDISLLFSRFIGRGEHDKGGCREISRCKWVVTDPPQCRTNLKDHFPARPYFTSERCERGDESGDHTHGRATRAPHVHPFLRRAISDRRSWFTLVRNFDHPTDSPRVSRLITTLPPLIPPRTENGNHFFR